MSALFDIFLFQLENLSVGYLNLLFYEVYADYFFRNGMFHLQAGIHFEEVIVAVLVYQKLDRSRTDIIDGFGGSHRFFSHIFPQFRSDENRRSFFHNLLIAALHGTFAFAKVNYVSVFVTQNLKLDVMGLFHELLQINRIVTERRKRFAFGGCIGLFHFFCTVDKAHPFSTATHRGFQHHRITDFIAKLHSFFHTFQVFLCAGHNGHSGFNHFDAGGNLVAHCFHCFRIGTDKDNAFFLTASCKSRILGQESISRMNGVCVVRFRHFDDFFYIQITLFRCGGTYTICFVCVEHMLCSPVCLGKYRDTRYFHLPAGAHHPHGYLTAIGY